MDTTKLMPVVLAVITNPKVIIAFAVVLLYWSFISFVLYYKKRPSRFSGKEKKINSSSPALNQPTETAAPAEEEPAEPAAEG